MDLGIELQESRESGSRAYSLGVEALKVEKLTVLKKWIFCRRMRVSSGCEVAKSRAVESQPRVRKSRRVDKKGRPFKQHRGNKEQNVSAAQRVQ